MAKRPRKLPDKKPLRRKPGAASRAAAALVGFLARHPTMVGGGAAFFVVFSFVSANALWYQHGEHPSPLFRTRDSSHPETVAGQRPGEEAQPGDVTTFKIERPDDQETASIDPGQASALVREVQNELGRRGLYNGAADGKTGPRTVAAILFFEETVGMEQSGEATPELLAALKIDEKGASTLPGNRPAEDVSSRDSEIDPVAAAILKAEKQTPLAKSADAAAAKPADAAMVMKIQKGLSNLAYADVRVDGVAGEQTRTAIRHFEKHYRLAETGEPNEKVLKKMKEIGAL